MGRFGVCMAIEIIGWTVGTATSNRMPLHCGATSLPSAGVGLADPYPKDLLFIGISGELASNPKPNRPRKKQQ